MSKPFKFRYVNEIVGAFVLLVAAALVAAVILVGRAQGWFEPTHEVFTNFPDEGAFGLQEGSEVVILGTRAGAVDRIVPQEDGGMQGVLEIKGRFYQYIRQDSVAWVKQKLGVGGDAYIEITRGTGPPLDPDAPTIPCRKEEDLFEALKTQAEEVKGAIMPTIEQLRKALESYTGLANDLRDPAGPLQQFLGRLNELAEGLEKGEGTMGELLKDPALSEKINALVTEFQTTVERGNDVLADVREASEELPGLARKADREMEKLPGLTDQAEQGLREAERLIEAIQRHWLIRPYVEGADRIPETVPPPDWPETNRTDAGGQP